MFLFLCFTDKLAVKRNDKKAVYSLYIVIYIFVYIVI